MKRSAGVAGSRSNRGADGLFRQQRIGSVGRSGAPRRAPSESCSASKISEKAFGEIRSRAGSRKAGVRLGVHAGDDAANQRADKRSQRGNRPNALVTRLHRRRKWDVVLHRDSRACDLSAFRSLLRCDDRHIRCLQLVDQYDSPRCQRAFCCAERCLRGRDRASEYRQRYSWWNTQ